MHRQLGKLFIESMSINQLFFFNNIFVEDSVIIRDSLESYYFDPSKYPLNKNEYIEKHLWYIGWECDFQNHGLSLNVKTLYNADQLKVNLQHRQKNPSTTIKSLLQSNYVFDTNNSDVIFEFNWKYAELIKNEIHIAALWGGLAQDITAFQFYCPVRCKGIYSIKIQRSKIKKDDAILQIVRDKLNSISSKITDSDIILN